MRLAIIVALAFSIAACSDDGAEELIAPPESAKPIEWVTGVKSLEEYRSANPARRIFAFFTMEGYDTIGMLLECELNQNRYEIFGDDDVVFLKFDCTDQRSLGLRELAKLKLNYIPVFVTDQSEGWKFTSNTNDYEDLYAGFVAEVAIFFR